MLGKHTSKVTPQAIEEAVRKLVSDPQQTKAALEPVCGWLWVETQLRSLGLNVEVSNPLKTRSIADSKRKNNEIDALTLADLLRVDYMPTSYVAPPDIRRLRTQVRIRSHIVQMRTSLTNRIKGIVTARGLHSLMDTCMTQRGYKKAVEQQQTDIVRMLDISRTLDAHIRVMDRELDETTKNDKTAAPLRTVPSVGAITAATIIAEVGDFSRFPSSGALCSYAGLVPAMRSSGGKERYGRIIKVGSKHLRTACIESGDTLSSASRRSVVCAVRA